MESNTFSRAYLQSLPSENKKIIIKEYLKFFVRQIIEDATTGKTSYTMPIYEASNNPHLVNNKYKIVRPDIATIDDIMEELKKIFPKCDVSYQEGWSETSPTTRSLKKSILINWS